MDELRPLLLLNFQHYLPKYLLEAGVFHRPISTKGALPPSPRSKLSRGGWLRGQWLPKQDGWGQECAGKHLSHRLRSFCLPYWLLTGVAVGLTVADIELTQHCLHQGTCHEGNPLVPTTNRAMLYPLQLGLTAAQSYLAYRLKRKGSKAWWVPQFSLSASHAVGVGFGLRFVWGE